MKKTLLILLILFLQINGYSQECFEPNDFWKEIRIYHYLEVDNILKASEYYSESFYVYKNGKFREADNTKEYPVLHAMFNLIQGKLLDNVKYNAYRDSVYSKLSEYKRRININDPNTETEEYKRLLRKDKLECLEFLAGKIIAKYTVDSVSSLGLSQNIISLKKELRYLSDSLNSQIIEYKRIGDSLKVELSISELQLSSRDSLIKALQNADSSAMVHINQMLIDSIQKLSIDLMRTRALLHQTRKKNSEVEEAASNREFQVQFESKEYFLNDLNKKVLDTLILNLDTLDNCGIFIYGFSNEKGNLETNFLYSEARIAAVVNYFTTKGLSSTRIKTFRFGRNEEQGNKVLIKLTCE